MQPTGQRRVARGAIRVVLLLEDSGLDSRLRGSLQPTQAIGNSASIKACKFVPEPETRTPIK